MVVFKMDIIHYVIHMVSRATLMASIHLKRVYSIPLRISAELLDLELLYPCSFGEHVGLTGI